MRPLWLEPRSAFAENFPGPLAVDQCTFKIDPEGKKAMSRMGSELSVAAACSRLVADLRSSRGQPTFATFCNYCCLNKCEHVLTCHVPWPMSLSQSIHVFLGVPGWLAARCKSICVQQRSVGIIYTLSNQTCKIPRVQTRTSGFLHIYGIPRVHHKNLGFSPPPCPGHNLGFKRTVSTWLGRI